MIKYLIIVFFGILSFKSLSQNLSLKLTEKKWKFCVCDTFLEPYLCDSSFTTYKFKKSGTFVLTGISFVLYGKTYKKIKGTWDLNWNILTFDRKDIKNLKSFPKSIEIIQLEENVFYSPQPDFKIFYWMFIRN